MNEKIRLFQGIGILLFGIYCGLWAVFLNVLALTNRPPVTMTAQNLMIASIPIALIGIGWMFWPGWRQTQAAE